MSMNLENLLHPFSLNVFFDKHWERTPLHVVRHEPDYFSSLLDTEEIDYLISSAASTDHSTVEIMRSAGEVEPLNPVRADRVAAVYHEFKKGATVRVYGVQKYLKPLQQVCRELEATFGGPVKVNLYCTPAGAQGAPRHYDNHEVFVAQLSGLKHWKIYAPVASLPLETIPPLPFEERGPELKYHRGGPGRSRSSIGEEAGAPIEEATLESGDLLYLPRGFIHEAATSETPSAHLTFGVHVTTWLDLMTVALAQLANRDERFRSSLPPNYLAGGVRSEQLREVFRELASTFATGADFEKALAEVGHSFIRNMQRVGDGTLLFASKTSAIEADTVLVRRAGLILRFLEEAEGCAIESALGSLSMPRAFAPALLFAAGHTSFAVNEIPGGLSERSQLSLARRMVEVGFFTLADKS